jgi:hypothetical protein
VSVRVAALAACGGTLSLPRLSPKLVVRTY